MVKIFIGNLAQEGAVVATDRDLKPLFELYGTVTECVVMENKGFG
jgi:RNA recognition motif-containing protein